MAEVITTSKICKNIPLEVADACTDAKQIPTSLAATLPSLGLSVKDFIALKLPGLLLPNLCSRGANGITPIRLSSLVIMWTAVRLYLGEVHGIYRYDSVSGKHESFTDAETVDGLNYLSLKVYAQIPRRNFFYHMVLVNESGHSLVLFTHTLISELVYLLAGSHVVYQILEVGGSDDCSDKEDDYEEPDEESWWKKCRLKAPCGGVKKARKNPKKPTMVRKQPAKKAPAVKAKKTGENCSISDLKHSLRVVG
ncbi:hypothetical protein DFH07DRAFT_769491 [Mycena maculata]|uniref:Uncharacterized protein n=1 Tax=Mycena maculata TaxID=230809 RepID=A0AAD7NMT8_9AGAR|nr:hypothetical protein DFH07DRAFT_769491 [Mycena maculata]